MEDFPRLGHEDELKDKKKSRKSRTKTSESFLETYLRFRDEHKSDSNDEETAEKKPSRLSKWFKKFGQLFGGIAKVEFVPKDKNDESSQNNYELKKDLESANELVLNEGLTEVKQPEKLMENKERGGEHPDSIMKGELKIQHDELVPNPAKRESELVRNIDERVLRDDLIFSREKNAAPTETILYDKETRQVANHAETVADRTERRNRRRYRRLRREVRKVKQVSRSLQEEKSDLEKGQQKFQEKLDKELVKKNELQKVILAERLRQQERFDNVSGESPVRYVKPEVLPQEITPKVKTEIETKYIKEISQKSEYVQPEIILKQVKEAAELNIPVEKVYERRHEIKDDDTKLRSVPKSLAQKNAAMSSQVNAPHTQMKKILSAESNIQSAALAQKQQDLNLYKKAVKNGFWTAIVLIAIWFTIYILK